MKTIKFTTNVNCGNCLKAITPYLQADMRIKDWNIDIDDPKKTLTVTGLIEARDIEEIFEKAGYEAMHPEQVQ